MSAGIFWLASYPKSGNTWFRVFLENLRGDSDQPARINELKTGMIASARFWIDIVLGFDSADLDADALDRLRPVVYRWTADHVDETGYYKIHDAYTCLPDGEPLVSRAATRGALYLLRNPLDVAISFAHHLRCSIDQAIAHMGNPDYAFCANPKRPDVQVRQKLLNWSGHVRSWVDAEGLAREVIRYEDLHARPLETFTRAAAFLGLPSERAPIEKALRFSHITELQRQEAEDRFQETPQGVPQFFRKGQVGDWRATLTPAQVARIVADHGEVMNRFGYLDAHGEPVEGAQPA
jgi:hypothetical protein